MSSSQHSIQFSESLKSVRVKSGAESLVSTAKMEGMLLARFQEGVEAGRKELAEQLVEQRNQLLQVQNGILRSLEHALPGVIAECEQSVVLLAFEAARRTVGALPATA